MYKFQYKYIKTKYNSAKFTDRDSLVYETETDDVYEDLSKRLKKFLSY